MSAIHIEAPRVDYKKFSGNSWANQAKPFANKSKLQETFKVSDLTP